MTDSAAKYQAEASQYLLKLDDHYRKDVENRTVELKAVTERLASMEMALSALKESLGDIKVAPPPNMAMPQPHVPLAHGPHPHGPAPMDPGVAERNPYDVDLEAFHEGGVVIDENHPNAHKEDVEATNNTAGKPRRKLSLSRPQLNGPRTMPIRWWGAPVPSDEAKARWDAVTGKKTGGGEPHGQGGTISSKKDMATNGEFIFTPSCSFPSWS